MVAAEPAVSLSNGSSACVKLDGKRLNGNAGKKSNPGSNLDFSHSVAQPFTAWETSLQDLLQALQGLSVRGRNPLVPAEGRP